MKITAIWMIILARQWHCTPNSLEDLIGNRVQDAINKKNSSLDYIKPTTIVAMEKKPKKQNPGFSLITIIKKIKKFNKKIKKAITPRRKLFMLLITGVVVLIIALKTKKKNQNQNQEMLLSFIKHLP